MKWLLIYAALCLPFVPLEVYRFRHPEKTDTQRVLEMREAYREFFMSLLGMP